MSDHKNYSGKVRSLFSAIAMLSHEQGEKAIAEICTLADIGIEFAEKMIAEEHVKFFSQLKNNTTPEELTDEADVFLQGLPDDFSKTETNHA